MGDGDWGMGNGGANADFIPRPQTPIPSPQLQTLVDRVGMPRPGSCEKPLPGGRSDGVVKEIL